MAVQEGPFATYADVTGVVDATAKAEVAVLVTNLKNLIPSGAAGSSPAAHPEFDALKAPDAVKLRAEIDALHGAIAAAPAA